MVELRFALGDPEQSTRHVVTFHSVRDSDDAFTMAVRSPNARRTSSVATCETAVTRVSQGPSGVALPIGPWELHPRQYYSLPFFLYRFLLSCHQ